jgi:HNH endonuclease/NUMOD4 motif
MEEWRPINNYPEYLISNLGRVKRGNKIKSYYTNNKGYCVVDLYKNNIRKKYSIHQLVCIHYLPNWNNCKEIDHINRNKCDNRVYNLRWCSRSDNLKNKEKKSGCSSIYKGVDFTKFGWRARKEKKHLGYFDTEINAYLATQK